jgi:multiple sugar transport system permease protein
VSEQSKISQQSHLVSVPATRGFSDIVEAHFKWIMLTPALALLVLLTLLPLINLFGMAVSTITFESGRDVWAFTPLVNLKTLIGDQIFRIALYNTLIFAIVTVSIEIALGLLLAIIVASIPFYKGIIRTTLVIPILLPPVAIGSMWKLMYNYDFGFFNQCLAMVGLDPLEWLSSTSLALMSVIIVDIWHWTPFVFLILFAAVEGISREVLEAAWIDGARNRDLVVKIIVPLLRPALFVAIVFRTILAFKVFDEVFLLTSGGPGTSTEVVGLHLYKIFFKQGDMGYGATLSLAIIAATIAFLWVGQRSAAAIERKVP